MAADGGVIITFIFTGIDEVPLDATHIIMHESVDVVPAEAFRGHPNIVEVYCHAGVKRIERYALAYCPRLRRVIMLGVRVVERLAFCGCAAMTDIECNELEIIKSRAFVCCTLLPSINLPSAKVVNEFAFYKCPALTDVKFGQHLESIKGYAFDSCPALESITIPLKNGMITNDNAFQGCLKLKHVDLVEEEVLKYTIAALLMKEWRIDMDQELALINQILPNTPAVHISITGYDPGQKARAIQWWLSCVLYKIIHYKAEHRRLLPEAVATPLTQTLPKDIVMNNILPSLELPIHKFEGEDE